MRFSIALLFALTSVSLATPLPKKGKASAAATTAAVADAAEATGAAEATAAAEATGAATAAAGADGSVLTEQDYADFQVSDGVSGDALAEVDAKFPVCSLPIFNLIPNIDVDQIDQTNLAGVSAADLDIIGKARTIAEDAEVGTGGFNEAIAAAGEDTAAGTALQNGKIKNKVEKLQLEVLQLQIESAQGAEDNAE